MTQGKVGQALLFDGVDDSVNAGNAASLQLTTGTISAWIKTTGAGSSFRAIVVKGNAYGLFLKDNVLMLYDWGASAERTTGTNLSDGNWHLVTQVFQSGVSNGTTVYVDGVLALTTTMTVSSQGVQLGIGDSVGSSQFFAGTIDEPRLYSRTLSASEIQSLYKLGQSDEVNSGASQSQGGSRLDSGLSGYWKMDDGSGTSATDASTNGNTGTLINGPTWGTGQISGAVTVDGTNDYVELGTGASLNIAAANTPFTVAGWVKTTDLRGPILSFRNSGSQYPTIDIMVGYNGVSVDDGNIMVYLRDDSASGSEIVGTTVNDNAWHHFVLRRYSGSAGTWELFVDGVSQGTTTGTNSSITTDYRTLGADRYWINAPFGSTDQQYLAGSIDDVRLHQRFLSDDEIAQLYRLTSPTGTDTGLKGYWSFNGKDISGTTAFDRSGAGNTGSLYNGPTVTAGKVGQALDFDAVNDHIETTDSSTVDFGDTDDFTLSGWFNRDTFTGTNALVGKRSGFAVGDAGYIAYIDATTDQLILQLSDGTDMYTITSASTFTATGWHHFAVVWDQDSAANSEIYIDGVDDNAADTGTIGNIGDLSNAFGFYIAARSDGGALFDGKIDEVRIHNRALTTGEITGLYNAGR